MDIKIRFAICLKFIKNVSLKINLFTVRIILTFLYFIIFPFCYLIYKLTQSRSGQAGWQNPKIKTFNPKNKY